MSLFSEIQELTKRDSKSWTVDACQFIELIPDAVCLLDEEGLMCYANSTFFSTIAQLGRLKNKDFLKSIIHPEHRDQMYVLIEEAIELKDDGSFIKMFPRCNTIVYRSPKAYNCYDDGTPVPIVHSKYFDWTVSSGVGMVMLSGKMSVDTAGCGAEAARGSDSPVPSGISLLNEPLESSSSRTVASSSKERDFILTSFVDELRQGLGSCRDSILELEPHVQARSSVNSMSTRIDKLISRADDIASVFDYESKQTVLAKEAEPVNIDAMIQSIIYDDEQRTIADKSSLRCSYQREPRDTDSLQVLISKVPLQRSIFHLIDNAFKYSASDTVVDIMLKIIPDEMKENICRVTFVVSNQATSLLDFHQIIENFRLSSASTSLAKFKGLSVVLGDSIGGVGIGLGVAFTSIKFLGGELTYTGHDRLCRFCVSFEAPMHDSQTSLLKPPKTVLSFTSLAALVNKKILLVDDSAVCLRIVNQIVQNLGYDTELAENGSIALDILKERSRDFVGVLMDFRMPVMDGLVATTRCRELNIQTPIVLLTVDSESLESTAKAAGVNMVLEKPPSSTDIQKAFNFVGI
jgi:CheY-like chemotaxis protein